MSLNNIIIIKEFVANGNPVYGIFDVSADEDDMDFGITKSDEIIPDLRTAIKHAQAREHEYGLCFIFQDN